MVDLSRPCDTCGKMIGGGFNFPLLRMIPYYEVGSTEESIY